MTAHHLTKHSWTKGIGNYSWANASGYAWEYHKDGKRNNAHGAVSPPAPTSIYFTLPALLGTLMLTCKSAGGDSNGHVMGVTNVLLVISRFLKTPSLYLSLN